ncbi:unnamed protein product, partial [Meganyctiphanes norvegica]
QLIQQCIGGLLLNLTMDQFKEVEGSLSRVVCWYLTCERYWEAGNMEPPEFPWALVTALVLLLTLGVSLAYYVVWVLCESQDQLVSTPVNNSCREREIPTRHQTKHRMSQGTESENECRDSGFNEGPLYPDGSDVSHAYSDYDTHSYRSRHYSEDSRLSYGTDDNRAPRYYLAEERMFNYATTFMPNYEQRRMRRNRYNYLDDYDNYHDLEQNDKYYDSSSLSREASDSFIYVSYPPDVKKRFTENR